MSFEDKEKRLAYQREYYQKNKDKIKEQQKIYYSEYSKYSDKEYRHEMYLKRKEYCKKYYQDNKEKIRLYQKERYNKINN